MNRICVYCGSNNGSRADYAAAAIELAEALVSVDIGLVYGGAARGLMGVLADTVLERGGEVTGIIPKVLQDKEVAHNSLTNLHVVDNMRERKAMMADMSDGFIALPGGLGTLDELMEAQTHTQLQLHAKPCGILNVAGYFDGLLTFLEHTVAEGFLRREHKDMLIVEHRPQPLLERLAAFEAPSAQKWMN